MFNKLLMVFLCTIGLSFVANGCAVPDVGHLPGSIMLDVGHDGYVVAHDGKVSSTKTGKATQESILGWITSGDSSLEASRTNGELTRISHVDWHGSHILGIIGDCTTITYGD